MVIAAASRLVLAVRNLRCMLKILLRKKARPNLLLSFILVLITTAVLINKKGSVQSRKEKQYQSYYK